jgi:hypothetical protein
MMCEATVYLNGKVIMRDDLMVEPTTVSSDCCTCSENAVISKHNIIENLIKSYCFLREFGLA